MSFWLHQARLKRNSLLWLFFFLIMALLMYAAIMAALMAILPWLPGGHVTNNIWADQRFQIIMVTLILVMTVFSGLQLLEINKGGTGLATRMAAHPIDETGRTHAEKILIDVCQEMATAALIPMPTLYVLPHENRINALVAGLSHTDTVLILTQGALDRLDRDSIQALIAHEFGHIKAGDALLNLRLLMVLASLDSLGELGRTCLSWCQAESGLIAVIAWSLYPMGQILRILGGTARFLGELVRARLSREREFLADATAIQFTRYPQGMLDLLGTLLEEQHPPGDEQSSDPACHHMFFHISQNSAWRATHPPLEDRIRAIDPAGLARWRARHRHHLASESHQDPRSNLDPIPYPVEIQEHSGK